MPIYEEEYLLGTGDWGSRYLGDCDGNCEECVYENNNYECSRWTKWKMQRKWLQQRKADGGERR